MCCTLLEFVYIQQSNSVCRIHCKGLVTSSQFFFTSFGIYRKFVSLNEVFTVTDIKLIKETSIITIQYIDSVEAPCGLRYACLPCVSDVILFTSPYCLSLLHSCIFCRKLRYPIKYMATCHAGCWITV